MHFKKLFIGILQILVFNSISFSQYQIVDYMPGYYITQSDTIRGYIGLPSFPDSSKIIVYKSDRNSKPVLINASETSLYKRNNDVFITKELKLKNKVEPYFVKPIIEDKLSLYKLWIHVYEIPDLKDKRYIYLADKEGFIIKFDDFTNYFSRRIILKLEDSDYLILPERRSNFVLSEYLSEYPNLALKIINNEFGKEEIDLVVEEFNNWYNIDSSLRIQDSIAIQELERKLNKYEDSKLSIEFPVAVNSINYKYGYIRGIFNLIAFKINKDISYGIGLKYSVYNSFKLRVGCQADRATFDLDYRKDNAGVKETFAMKRNTSYLSLMYERKLSFVSGGIELEKYNIESINKTYDYTPILDSYNTRLTEINFINNPKVNFQILAGFKLYTKYGLRFNPFIAYSHPLTKIDGLSTDIVFKEITLGCIFEFRISGSD